MDTAFTVSRLNNFLPTHSKYLCMSLAEKQTRVTRAVDLSNGISTSYSLITDIIIYHE